MMSVSARYLKRLGPVRIAVYGVWLICMLSISILYLLEVFAPSWWMLFRAHQLLNSRDSLARWHGVAMLLERRFDSTGVVDSLREAAIGDEDASVAEAAVLTLGQIGTRESTVALVAVLSAETTGEKIKLCSAEVLAETGHSSIELLVEVLNDRTLSESSRYFAAWALGRTVSGQQAIPVLEQHLSTDDGRLLCGVAGALLRHGKEDALGALIRILKQPHDVPVETIIGEIGFAEPRRAIPELLLCLEQDASMRERVIDAIKKFAGSDIPDDVAILTDVEWRKWWNELVEKGQCPRKRQYLMNEVPYGASHLRER